MLGVGTRGVFASYLADSCTRQPETVENYEVRSIKLVHFASPPNVQQRSTCRRHSRHTRHPRHLRILNRASCRPLCMRLPPEALLPEKACPSLKTMVLFCWHVSTRPSLQQSLLLLLLLPDVRIQGRMRTTVYRWCSLRTRGQGGLTPRSDSTVLTLRRGGCGWVRGCAFIRTTSTVSWNVSFDLSTAVSFLP